jgi:hypothetical protein
MSTPVWNPETRTSVGKRENKRRWYALRYVRQCRYPASVRELSEHVGPRIGAPPAETAEHLFQRDLPVLAGCRAVEFDPESELVCLDEAREPFADRVRRAIALGVITHLKPPRIKRNQQGVFY